MRKSKETWRAVHAVLLNELRFRLGAGGSLTDQELDFLADNLTDIVVANFETTARRR